MKEAISKTQLVPYRESVEKFVPTSQDALFRLRSEAFDRFKAFGFPTRKHEAWKYIYLDSILNSAYSEVKESGIISEKKYPTLAEGYDKLNSFHQQWLRESVGREENPFSLINTFSFVDGLLIHVPKGKTLKETFQFETAEKSASFLFNPRIVLILEEDAHAELVLDHKSFTDNAYFVNAVMDIYLAKNATFRLSQFQRDLSNVNSFIKIKAELCEKSRFEMLSFTEGGLTTRQEVQVDFCGAGASCDLKNLSLLNGTSRFYQHATANHHVPECQSNQLFKTILVDEAQSEVNSMVHVVRDAQKSESKQLNRNLLLSKQARIYSRPQLKIYADDVKCSHGAATGQLDENELFYLRSRGISKEQARYMMTLAFAEEVLQLIEPESLRKEIEASVSKKLEKIA